MAPRHRVPDSYMRLIRELGVEANVKIIMYDISVSDYVNLADAVVWVKIFLF